MNLCVHTPSEAPPPRVSHCVSQKEKPQQARRKEISGLTGALQQQGIGEEADSHLRLTSPGSSRMDIHPFLKLRRSG